jgi:hypothetical protein
MSSQLNWSFKPIPTWVKSRYGNKLYQTLNDFTKRELVQWRMTGSTHFQIANVTKTLICTLTSGDTSSNLVYAAKCRTFIRRIQTEVSNVTE